jgi:hypothetical protein
MSFLLQSIHCRVAITDGRSRKLYLKALYYSFTDMDFRMAAFTDSEMIKDAGRLTTFEKWPVSFISKNDMAAAGFHFQDRQDWVRCPFCVYVYTGCVTFLRYGPARNWAMASSFLRRNIRYIVEIGVYRYWLQHS